MRFTRFILFILLLAPFHLFGQTDTLCRSELISYLRKMSAIGEPDSNTTHFLDYTAITDFAVKSGYPEKKVRFKLYFSRDLLMLNSDVITMFSDTVESFILLHEQKAILISGGNQGNKALDDAMEVFNLQLTILNTNTMNSCEEKTIDNIPFRISSFMLSDEMEKQFSVHSLKVWYNLESQRIFKVESNLNKSAYPVEKQIVIYNQLDLNSTVALKGTARERVMKNKTELLPKYKGYTFINQ